jgi:hypothetical protein
MSKEHSEGSAGHFCMNLPCCRTCDLCTTFVVVLLEAPAAAAARESFFVGFQMSA